MSFNQSSGYLDLGYYHFINDTTEIKVWTELPNGMADLNPNNDTLVFNYIPHGLNGIYTVGGSNPDYIDINSALADLYQKGLCGNVYFDIRLVFIVVLILGIYQTFFIKI